MGCLTISNNLSFCLQTTLQFVALHGLPHPNRAAGCVRAGQTSLAEGQAGLLGRRQYGWFRGPARVGRLLWHGQERSVAPHPPPPHPPRRRINNTHAQCHYYMSLRWYRSGPRWCSKRGIGFSHIECVSFPSNRPTWKGIDISGIDVPPFIFRICFPVNALICRLVPNLSCWCALFCLICCLINEWIAWVGHRKGTFLGCSVHWPG